MEISQTSPFVATDSAHPKKKSISLIRCHYKVYIAICYQLVQFFISCTVLACSFYVRSPSMMYIFHRIEKFPEIEFIKELMLRIKASTTYYTLVPFVGGLVMATINGLLIHQCFKHGIHYASNICGIIAIMIISLILSSGSFYVYYDISHYPNNKVGAVQDKIYLFIHIVKAALEKNDPILNEIVYNIHEKLECCGFNSAADFYNMRQIDYLPRHKNDSRNVFRHSFRISNRWAHECSRNQSAIFNKTHICYAPSFCCRSDPKNNKKSCPPLRLKHLEEINPSRRLYTYPCAKRIANNMRNKALNLTVFPLVNIVVAFANAVHLFLL